jgi:branched-chain amino acid transport system substrate-binding protein
MKPFIVLSIYFLSIVLISCNSNKSDIIKLGADLPLTGDIASYGKRAQNGINLAVEEINSIKNNKIKFFIDFQDNKGNSADAVNIMNKFCSIDKYPVVIGGASSGESSAMIPIANKYDVVEISPISSSPDLSKKDYFFRVCPSDAYQAVIMAEWLKNINIYKVGILYVNNNWGKSLKDKFIERYFKIGGLVTEIESLDGGDRDFKTQLTKIINSNCDAIYCISYGAEGGIILKQLKELRYRKKIFGADVWGSPELISGAGDASDNVFIIKPSEFKDSTFQQFRKKYISKYKEEPDVYAAYSYDIIYILFNVFSHGNYKGNIIHNYLLTMPEFKGVTGITKFDGNGDCNSKPFIKQQIKKGKFLQIDNN